MAEKPDAPPTGARIWRRMTDGQRLRAAEAFWADSEAGAQHVEAIYALARHLHFRPRSLTALPPSKKARHLASLRQVPESVALRALVAHHLAHQRPMMGAFLDRLGVAHDNGLIAAESLDVPDEERLRSAVAALEASHPHDDVGIYLATLVAQDPETWAGLMPLLARVGASPAV
jgi:hypothetical protein